MSTLINPHTYFCWFCCLLQTFQSYKNRSTLRSSILRGLFLVFVLTLDAVLLGRVDPEHCMQHKNVWYWHPYHAVSQMLENIQIIAKVSMNNFAELSGCVFSWIEEQCKPGELQELMGAILRQVKTCRQCWGSVPFWCGSVTIWLTDPDPTPDPIFFFRDYKDAKKIIFFIWLTDPDPGGPKTCESGSPTLLAG